MKRQRGNADLYVALAIIVVLGLLIGGFAWWLAREKAAAYDAGKAFVQQEWDAANIEAARLKAKTDEEVSRALGTLAAQVAAANSRADKSNAQAEEDRRANRGKQLASCEQPGEDPPALASAQGAGSGIRAGPGEPAGRSFVPVSGAGNPPRIRLLWRFVGLRDGKFTGLDGEPLFAASRGYALDPVRADTASPYTLDDELDVEGDNAVKLSACRRDVVKARAVVQAAADAWDKAQGRTPTTKEEPVR